MEDLDEKSVRKITRQVIENCSVYPKPKEQEVREEIKKINSLFETELEGVSERRIVRRLTKSFELKKRIREDEWIKYEGDLIDIER